MNHVSRAALGLGVLLYTMVGTLSSLSSADERSAAQARVMATEFDKVAHVTAIPAPVVKALAPLLAGKHLVDPVYLDKATNTWKPNTDDRLLFAAKSPTLWLVHYEQQRPTPSRHLAIIELQGRDDAVVLEHSLMNEQAFSVPALKSMIERGQLKTVAEVQSTNDIK